MPIKTYTLSLKNRTQISDTVSHFCFTMGDEPVPEYIPGQFITIHINHQGKDLKRSYSIANTAPNHEIEFAASFVPNGPASELLFNMPIGDILTVSGPYGRLILKDEPVTRYILIATSTGVTPYRAMLRALSEKCKQDPALEVVIIQGAQYRSHVIYQGEFLEFTNAHPNASFYTALSRETDDHLASHEKKGYVQSVLESLHPNPEQDLVYLCGNPEMIDDAFEQLKTLSFDPKNIRREKYLSR